MPGLGAICNPVSIAKYQRDGREPAAAWNFANRGVTVHVI